VPPLTPAQVRLLRKQLHKDWQIAEDSKSLKRSLKFKDFYRTMSFVNAVAHIANVQDHHPDIECGWGYARIRYQTHAIGGLHENDFICAAKIDAIAG
jgi:4a-hydroxytetrahydrobiopterin dehydratase